MAELWPNLFCALGRFDFWNRCRLLALGAASVVYWHDVSASWDETVKPYTAVIRYRTVPYSVQDSSCTSTEGRGNRTGRVEERERRTSIADTQASAVADAGRATEHAKTGGVGERTRRGRRGGRTSGARVRGAGRDVCGALYGRGSDDASRGATAARDVAGAGMVATRGAWERGGARVAGRAAGDDAQSFTTSEIGEARVGGRVSQLIADSTFVSVHGISKAVRELQAGQHPIVAPLALTLILGQIETSAISGPGGTRGRGCICGKGGEDEVPKLELSFDERCEIDNIFGGGTGGTVEEGDECHRFSGDGAGRWNADYHDKHADNRASPPPPRQASLLGTGMDHPDPDEGYFKLRPSMRVRIHPRIAACLVPACRRHSMDSAASRSPPTALSPLMPPRFNASRARQALGRRGVSPLFEPGDDAWCRRVEP
ncbi:hypothetical protein FB451DRAFT_1195147 [Mycena latifolia]|nr:hypothetical protein FB451DRAFT_1195147 [Mycena latifolia]